MERPLDIPSVLNKLVNGKWSIDKTYYKSLFDAAVQLMEGKDISKLMSQYAHENTPSQPQALFDEDEPTVAIIQINGVLGKHLSEAEKVLLGGCDVDDIWAALDNAVNDPSVHCILFHFNSPGGSVVGIEELGRAIAEAGEIKDTYAFTDSVCASASWWLASLCNSIIVTPSSQIGGVGVFSLILNDEEKMKKEGIKIEAFVNEGGTFKAMGHSWHTLSEDERNYLQEDVDKQAVFFKETILSKRKIAESDLTGLAYEGREAVEKGYADALVDSLDELIADIQMEWSADNKGQTMQTVKTNKVALTASPAMKEAVEKLEAELVALKKQMGGYDDKYVEKKVDGPADSPNKKDPNRDTHNQPAPDKHDTDTYQEEECGRSEEEEKKAKIPGLPGVAEEEEEGGYDAGYCSKCGSKMKKSKKDDDETEEEEEEEEEEKATDKKMEATAPVEVKAEAPAVEKKAEVPAPAPEVKPDMSNEAWQKAKNELAGLKGPKTELSEWQKAVQEFSGLAQKAFLE